MPTYAYRCAACSHEFQRFEKMSASTRKSCPACGERADRMITGGAGISVGRAAESCPEPVRPDGCCGGGMCGLN